MTAKIAEIQGFWQWFENLILILTFSKKHWLKIENINRITKKDSWVPDFVFAWESKMFQNLHGMSTRPKDAVKA